MEIEKTFIVQTSGTGSESRFIKVYLSNGRYFKQIAQGAISELSKREFDDLNKD